MGITTPRDDGQTPLDPDEAQGLLPSWIATRSDLNVAEEENIEAGMVWGGRAIRRQPVLTQEFLRRLHKRMFGRVWAWAGQYRNSERNVGVPSHSISTIHFQTGMAVVHAYFLTCIWNSVVRSNSRGEPGCRASNSVAPIWTLFEQQMRWTIRH